MYRKPGIAVTSVGFLWLEITAKCNLNCTHCYAESSPLGTHGTLTNNDWYRLIDDAAALDVRMVQFIGGEPTLHPALPAMIDRALRHEIDVEVFTNLTYVKPELWATLSRPRVSLATSYYSDDSTQHSNITGDRFQAVRRELTQHFRTRTISDCRPDCEPQQLCEPKCDPYNAGCHPECNPSCSPRCDPISCRPSCLPPRR